MASNQNSLIARTTFGNPAIHLNFITMIIWITNLLTYVGTEDLYGI